MSVISAPTPSPRSTLPTLPMTDMIPIPPTPISSQIPTRPQSPSSSRNDLFTVSWKPEILPPKPMALTSDGSIHGRARGSSLGKVVFGPEDLARADENGAGPSRLSSSSVRSPGSREVSPYTANRDRVSESTITPSTSTSTTSTIPGSSSRTSSFFDLSALGTVTPPPAPRLQSAYKDTPTPSGPPSWAPSPLSLSRASSLRNRTHPPSLDPSSPAFINSSTQLPRSGSRQRAATGQSRGQSPYVFNEDDPLSPLHASPSLPPSDAHQFPRWQPPLPPCSEDIDLRLIPNSTYLLGEGRYAKVFLASYRHNTDKNDTDSKGKGRELLGRTVLTTTTVLPVRSRSGGETGGETGVDAEDEKEPWRLCAAKRLAPDRESQTMGLREAFFLNRLSGVAPIPKSRNSSLERSTPADKRTRSRATSPLRNGFPGSTRIESNSIETSLDSLAPPPPPKGSVYVVKLIAVKEDWDDSPRRYSHDPSHSRSVSDATSQPRQRSTSIFSESMTVPSTPDEARSHPTNTGTLSSFPSLPSLNGRADVNGSQPSLSRLVLILEHAPLGTMDRLLRTSPGLVGRELWERWARESVEALVWVHGKGVVHADVKPGNLLLTTDLHLRLSDFGSSLLIHPSHPPTDGLGLGTLPFSPPELVDPSQSFSFPVDVFALGATLYQCLTGREPFRGSRSVEMMHHVRKGGLWDYEERERLGRVGSGENGSFSSGMGGSPYPSAWREEGTYLNPGGGVKRGGSLRVPPHSYTSNEPGTTNNIVIGLPTTSEPSHQSPPQPSLHQTPSGTIPKQRLTRMSSAESLRASEEIVDGQHSSESPAGVKLYANWVRRNGSLSVSTSSPSGGGGVYGYTTGGSAPGSGGGGSVSGVGVGYGMDPIGVLLGDDDSAWPISPSPGSSFSVPGRQGSLKTSLGTSGTGGGRLSIEPLSRRSSVSLSASTSTQLSPSSPISPISPPGGQATVPPPPPPKPSSSALPQTSNSSANPTLDPSGTGTDVEMTYYEPQPDTLDTNKPYKDGSPSMTYLNNSGRVSEEVRQVLKGMLCPSPGGRPTAEEVLEAWEGLGVGLE